MVKTTEEGKWYRVSLRLMGNNLPIEDIETKLGIKPSHIGIKGERYQNNPKRDEYPTNIWVWNYSAESEIAFEDSIPQMLNLLEKKATTLKEIISIPDVTGELFLGYGSNNGQGGCYFSPQTLARIAELGLSIDLDLYPPPGDED